MADDQRLVFEILARLRDEASSGLRELKGAVDSAGAGVKDVGQQSEVSSGSLRTLSREARGLVAPLLSELSPALAGTAQQLTQVTRFALQFGTGLGVMVAGVGAAVIAVTQYVQAANRMAEDQAKLNLAIRNFDTSVFRSQLSAVTADLELMAVRSRTVVGQIQNDLAGLFRTLTGGQSPLEKARELREELAKAFTAFELPQGLLGLQGKLLPVLEAGAGFALSMARSEREVADILARQIDLLVHRLSVQRQLEQLELRLKDLRLEEQKIAPDDPQRQFLRLQMADLARVETLQRRTEEGRTRLGAEGQLLAIQQERLREFERGNVAQRRAIELEELRMNLARSASRTELEFVREAFTIRLKTLEVAERQIRVYEEELRVLKDRAAEDERQRRTVETRVLAPRVRALREFQREAIERGAIPGPTGRPLFAPIVTPGPFGTAGSLQPAPEELAQRRLEADVEEARAMIQSLGPSPQSRAALAEMMEKLRAVRDEAEKLRLQLGPGPQVLREQEAFLRMLDEQQNRTTLLIQSEREMADVRSVVRDPRTGRLDITGRGLSRAQLLEAEGREVERLYELTLDKLNAVERQYDQLRRLQGAPGIEPQSFRGGGSLPIMRVGLSAEEQAAIRDFEESESRWTFKYGRISPFNQGQWPSDEEIAERQRKIREQMRRMRKENPRLYERLPLLHEPESRLGAAVVPVSAGEPPLEFGIEGGRGAPLIGGKDVEDAARALYTQMLELYAALNALTRRGVSVLRSEREQELEEARAGFDVLQRREELAEGRLEVGRARGGLSAVETTRGRLQLRAAGLQRQEQFIEVLRGQQAEFEKIPEAADRVLALRREVEQLEVSTGKARDALTVDMQRALEESDWLGGLKAGLVEVSDGFDRWGVKVQNVVRQTADIMADQMTEKFFAVIEGRFEDLAQISQQAGRAVLRAFVSEISKGLIESTFGQLRRALFGGATGIQVGPARGMMSALPVVVAGGAAAGAGGVPAWVTAPGGQMILTGGGSLAPVVFGGPATIGATGVTSSAGSMGFPLPPVGGVFSQASGQIAEFWNSPIFQQAAVAAFPVGVTTAELAAMGIPASQMGFAAAELGAVGVPVGGAGGAATGAGLTVGAALGAAAAGVGLALTVYSALQGPPTAENIAISAVSGAVSGAVIGSVFPVIGTAVGAIVGALIGGGAAAAGKGGAGARDAKRKQERAETGNALLKRLAGAVTAARSAAEAEVEPILKRELSGGFRGLREKEVALQELVEQQKVAVRVFDDTLIGTPMPGGRHGASTAAGVLRRIAVLIQSGQFVLPLPDFATLAAPAAQPAAFSFGGGSQPGGKSQPGAKGAGGFQPGPPAPATQAPFSSVPPHTDFAEIAALTHWGATEIDDGRINSTGEFATSVGGTPVFDLLHDVAEIRRRLTTDIAGDLARTRAEIARALFGGRRRIPVAFEEGFEPGFSIRRTIVPATEEALFTGRDLLTLPRALLRERLDPDLAEEILRALAEVDRDRQLGIIHRELGVG